MSQSFFYPAQSISIPGVATAANQLLEIAALNSIDAKLTSPLAVTGPLTDVQLRASAVPISAASLPLPTGAATEATLLSIDSKLTSPLSVIGPLTDAQLRASAVPVSAASLPLPSGAATEATLLSIDSKLTSPISVTGPLTDAQLRASAVPVSAASLPLPTGAATEATLSNVETILSSSDSLLASIDVKLTAPLSVSAASLPLPTGAATEATLSALNTKIPANLTVSSTRLLVDGSGVTQPISAAALPLPTGAATETTLSSINTKTPSLGQAAMSASQPVVIASDQSNVPVITKGKSRANAPVRNDYTSTSVTTSAYVQLVASLSSACSEIEIFDSSGQTLVLATGAASSEVDQMIIFPGGNGRVPLAIAASTRVSIKALSATANTGEIDINFYT